MELETTLPRSPDPPKRRPKTYHPLLLFFIFLVSCALFFFFWWVPFYYCVHSYISFKQWVLEVCFPTGTQEQSNGNDMKFMIDLLQGIEREGIPAHSPIEQRWTASSSSFMVRNFFLDILIYIYIYENVAHSQTHSKKEKKREKTCCVLERFYCPAFSCIFLTIVYLLVFFSHIYLWFRRSHITHTHSLLLMGQRVVYIPGWVLLITYHRVYLTKMNPNIRNKYNNDVILQNYSRVHIVI